MGFKLGFAAVIGAVLLGAVIKVPERWFYTEFKLTPRPQGAADQAQTPNPDKDGVQFETVHFLSSEPGLKLHGWVFTPTKDLSLQNEKQQFPFIIMAHGIGATKDMGLLPFAMEFAKSGFMVLMLDYLHFGNSDGTPRHQINPFQHVADFQSAIRYGERHEMVDHSRIALWGSSYAGGHVLVTASKESNIAAVISQMPFLGPTPDENPMDELKKRGFDNVAIGFLGAASSKLRRIMGLPPLYTRLYGHVGDGNKMALNYWENFDGDDSKWLEKHPRERRNDWRNAVSTDSVLNMIKYKPIQYVDGIDSRKTKVLVVQAKHDLLCPNHRMDYVIDKLKCERHMEDTTHFGMYTGKTFESVIEVQKSFFLKHLQPVKVIKSLEE